MMRNDPSDETFANDVCDKENIDPFSGTMSPRQKKKGSLRANVLKELTIRSVSRRVEEQPEEAVDDEISAVFEKLDAPSVTRKDFREL